MLIPPSELNLIWGLTCHGVLHVGAHMAEEAKQYEKVNWGHVTWVECQPNLVKMLRENLDPKIHTVLEATVFDKNGVALSLNVSNSSQSSSLLEFGTHKMDYPEIEITHKLEVISTRLDSLLEDVPIGNFLNIDIQGVELRALLGLGNLIEKIEYIYIEVNKNEVYINCDKFHEIETFLNTKGFFRLAVRWHWLQGWGDALYSRSKPHRSMFQKTMWVVKNIQFYKPQLKSIIFHYLKFAFEIKRIFR